MAAIRVGVGVGVVVSMGVACQPTFCQKMILIMACDAQKRNSKPNCEDDIGKANLEDFLFPSLTLSLSVSLILYFS